MNSVRITNEMREFFAKVQAGTSQGAIDWEITADANMLMAALDPEFIVRLEKGVGSYVSEYALSLVKSREVMFRLSPEDLGEDSASLRDSVKTFRALWETASSKAREINDDLNRVNRLLDERLSATKAPFWKAQASSR